MNDHATPSLSGATPQGSTPASAAASDDDRHAFDFLHGRWRVHNQRLDARLAGSGHWEIFEAINECRPLLGGLGNLEEFHTAWDGGYEGIALRLYEPATRQWRIHWASDRTGVLDPPMSGGFENAVGVFLGEDRHAGQPVRVRFLWHRHSDCSAHWQQAFSSDNGHSWETNWHMWFRRIDADDRMLHEDAIVELRQYTLHPGQRDTLIELFEREFVETQEAVGMHVIATFRDLDAPDRFVWLRGFPSMPARRAALQDFYGGPVWQRHRNDANATMIDSDNVLLLRPVDAATAAIAPATPRPGHDEARPGGAFCLGTCQLAAPAEPGLADIFTNRLQPLLQRHGGEAQLAYLTESSANTFPQLPVREGEFALVWLSRFDDVATLDRFVHALRADPDWQALAKGTNLPTLTQPPQLQRLLPTARSERR